MFLNRFSLMGPLYNEWLVDMWSRVEDEKLNYLSSPQAQARVAKRSELVTGAGGNAGRVILPASFQGSERSKAVAVADALALCKHFGGNPHLFDV